MSAELCRWSFAAIAAAPTLDHIYPVALQAGTTNSVTAIGKFDPWPPKVWLDAPEIAFNAETNTGKFTVEVAANAPIGPHLVRVFNDQGASAPRFLIVTSEAQSAEEEPNDDFKKPQMLTNLPISINGRLDKSGDVDSFAIALDAGQTLIARLECYTLASPVDAVLRLLDTRAVPIIDAYASIIGGIQVALNHDDGRTLDPLLTWTAKTSGTYTLQVFGFAYPATAEVKFTGGNACVYRLHVSRGPYLQHTIPLGIQRGAPTGLQLFGWNLGSGLGREFEFDGTSLAAEATQTVLRIPGIENVIALSISDGLEWRESALTHATNGTITLEVPFAVSGCIAKTGEEDRYQFSAKKNERLVLQVQSASLGFPLDARLRLEDGKGKEVTKKDDGVNSDPVLDWTVPEDGVFVAVLGNVLHRAGPDHRYRLGVRQAVPALKATVAENAFTIEPGKTNEIKVTVNRLHGFDSKLRVSAQGFPEGVMAEPVDVPEKGGELVLKLVASSEAQPFSGSFRIVATDTESGREHPVRHELISSGVNNGVPQGFNKLVIESTDNLWLTVLSPSIKKEDAKK